MRPGLIILGLGCIFLSLIILGETEGGLFFFGMIIVGILLIISGLKGSRTFQCVKCKRTFETRDSAQGKILSCPICNEEYILQDNKIINLNEFISFISAQQQRPCPKCNHILTIDYIKDRWQCENCGFVEAS